MSIAVQGVTRFFGTQKALDDVSFRVETGLITGFLGPNGAGKSTMMKIITGFIPASSGEVLVNGLDTRVSGNEIKKQIGYLPENNPLYPEMYVREYLGFVASVYKLPRPHKQLIDNIIEITGLTSEHRKTIGSLSKGYRQRVGLAQALIHNPQVLILDEATTGLDPNQIVEIRNLIRAAGREKTVLLSTHIMQEVEAICDRVIVIDHGKIKADEDISAIYSLTGNKNRSIKIEFDREPAPGSLEALPFISSVTRLRDNTWLILARDDEDIRPALFSYAVNNNLTVLSLQQQESNLEEVFRHLTND